MASALAFPALRCQARTASDMSLMPRSIPAGAHRATLDNRMLLVLGFLCLIMLIVSRCKPSQINSTRHPRPAARGLVGGGRRLR
jgi:hypothetical protein